MGRGKGRRGRGRGLRGQWAPVPETKSPSPNVTESSSQSNLSAASEQEGEINHFEGMVEVDDMVDYVYITMSHSHLQQLEEGEEDGNFPFISASQATGAAEAVVMTDDQVPAPPFQQEMAVSRNESLGTGMGSSRNHYNVQVIHPDSSTANEAEPSAIVVEHRRSSRPVTEMKGNKRIIYVDLLQQYIPDESDGLSAPWENGYGEAATEDVRTREAEEGLGPNPNLQLREGPVPVINPQLFDRIDLTPVLTSQTGNPPGLSRPRMRGMQTSTRTAKMACGPNKRRRMKTPPPPRQLPQRACKAVSKFTPEIKEKVVAYIKQVKKVGGKEDKDKAFPKHTEDSWMSVFIQSCISANSDLTVDDVRIWINHFPEIFTPKAIRNLREHCNRLGEEDEADDEKSESDYDVKHDPLENLLD